MPQKIRVVRSENFLQTLIDVMIIMHDQGIENHDIIID